ncbi:MAG: hypothetical protein ACT4P7_00585 [Gemmatimonadaceae bacterium]
MAAIEDEIAKQKKYQGRAGYRNDKVINTFDVLTRRNRAFSGDVTLRQALAAPMACHKYTNVHCFSCRPPM